MKFADQRSQQRPRNKAHADSSTYAGSPKEKAPDIPSNSRLPIMHPEAFHQSDQTK